MSPRPPSCPYPAKGDMARIRRLEAGGRVVWAIEAFGKAVETRPGTYVGVVTEVRCQESSALCLVRVKGLGEIEAVAGVIRQ